MKDTFARQLLSLAAKDPKILLIAGDLGFGAFEEFERKFPKQYLNAGVAEQNMTGLAAGLALEGRTVFTYSIANFPILRCLEQLRNDVCYHRANVKVVSIGAGFSYGSLGFSHHATEDLAVMRSLPEMTVVSPCDLWEAAEATKTLAKTPGPAYLRLDKSSAGQTRRTGETFQLGKIRTVREGNDVSFIGTGGIVGTALKAAEDLSRHGIQARVLSVHTIKPLDTETLFRAARETGGIVTLEEHTVFGGLGSAVAESCLEEGIIPLFFYRAGLRDGFSSIVGSQSYLREKYHMDEKSLVKKTLQLLRQPASLKKTALK